MNALAGHACLLLIVAGSILLMLVRPRGIAEFWWVVSGAVLLVLLRLVPLSLAGRAVGEGLDVYLFLIGMMLLAELARESGVFNWISSAAVRGARGEAARLFTLMYAAGTLVTICMSNDATAVVLTPAVLSAVRKAKVEPLPSLFACAMVANAASFVLPVSNPANLVVFQSGMPSLGRWLMAFGLPSLFSISATYLVLRLYFRAELKGKISSTPEARELGTSGWFVLGGLIVVIAVLLTSSALNVKLGLPTCISAICVSGVVSIQARRSPWRLASGISWSTLLLVAGLFVLVDSVESLGALRYTVAGLTWTMHRPPALAALLVSFTIGVGNNLVNNLPLGLIAGATVHAAKATGLLTHAVLLGVDLGPNLSITGSLATILWLLALRQGGVQVRAWDFLKLGLLAMPVAMLASTAGLLLTHAIRGPH